MLQLYLLVPPEPKPEIGKGKLVDFSYVIFLPFFHGNMKEAARFKPGRMTKSALRQLNN